MFSSFNTFGRLGAAAAGAKSLAQQIAAMAPSLWLEPSLTNYQDSAGTTLVTQPGGGSADPPVGKALDLSGLGNHAIQSTSTARPVLSARANLVTYTEDFINSLWQKNSVAVSSNSIAAPDGTTNADKLYPSSTGTNKFIYQIFNTSAGIYSWSVFAKAGEKSILYIDFTGDGLYRTYFNLSSGTVGDVASGYSASIISVGDGWYRCSGKNNTASSYSFSGVYGVADQNGSASVVANGTDGIYIWGAQLQLSSTATAYQRVTDASNYAYTGWPLIYQFDGVDDVLNVTFPSSLGSDCTVVTANRGTTPTILTGQTIGTSYTITATNAGRLVFPRALTAAETAIVTTWATQKGALPA